MPNLAAHRTSTKRTTRNTRFQAPHLLLATLITLCLQSTFATASGGVTLLTNDDFRFGTYIIDKPGVYRLAEDISFNPNAPDTLTQAIADGEIPAPIAQALELPLPPQRVDAYRAGIPLPTQFLAAEPAPFTPGGPLDARYDPAGFGLGFFAAIVIQARGVVLDLNGHTIEQSAEHALLQRFFAVIELAEQPFIPSQGPSDFGDEIISAKNVVIKNGTIGRSAHHGIHGNSNRNIVIANVDFVDFEVAALALNGVKGLVVRNSNATNRKDVPVIGTFSSAQFIKPYLDELVRTNSATTLTVSGTALSATQIRDALRNAVNNVHADLIATPNNVDGRAQINEAAHPEEYALFHNAFGVIDGNAYGYLVNANGVAVDGFPTRSANPARNVLFSNVHIEAQHAFINEIVALNQADKAVIDPIGAVFQIRNVHPGSGAPVTMSSLGADAAYTGNVVANAQALVAKAIIAGDFAESNLSTRRNAITDAVLNWVEAAPGFERLDSIAAAPGDWFCNGDSMFHVNKGVIGFKMDAARNVIMHRTSVTDIQNLGGAGSEICGDYSGAKSHPKATLLGYGGARTRAYSFAGTARAVVMRSDAEDISASAGSAIGVDILTDSRNISIKSVDVDGIEAGLNGPANYSGPNEAPQAVGFQVGEDARRVSLKRICADMLSGFDGEAIIDDLSGTALIQHVCR